MSVVNSLKKSCAWKGKYCKLLQRLIWKHLLKDKRGILSMVRFKIQRDKIHIYFSLHSSLFLHYINTMPSWYMACGTYTMYRFIYLNLYQTVCLHMTFLFFLYSFLITSNKDYIRLFLLSVALCSTPFSPKYHLIFLCSLSAFLYLMTQAFLSLSLCSYSWC